MKNIEQTTIYLVNELRKTQQDFASVNSEDINSIIYQIGKSITFNKLDLSKRDLRSVDFRDCFLGDFANFSNSDLRGAQFQSSNLDFVNFAGANLEGVQLQKASLQFANFDDVVFDGVNLEGANLNFAHPMGANFNGAILPSDQYKVDEATGFLIGSKLNYRGVDLSNFDLSGANLSGAQLRRTNLQGVDLTTTKLFGAELLDADLRGANLQGVDLTNVELQDADLRGANLSGVILNEEMFKSLVSMSEIKMNNQTILPENLKDSMLFTEDSYLCVIFYNKK